MRVDIRRPIATAVLGACLGRLQRHRLGPALFALYAFASHVCFPGRHPARHGAVGRGVDLLWRRS